MKKKMGIRDCVLIETRGWGVGAFIYYVVLFLPWLGLKVQRLMVRCDDCESVVSEKRRRKKGESLNFVLCIVPIQIHTAQL